MNEYEIFNSDEDDVLVESQPQPKVEENKASKFWNNLFSFEFLPVALSILSILLTAVSVFLRFFVGSNILNAIFFIASFGVALSAIIISIIPMVINKKLIVNVQLILSILSLIFTLPF